MSMTTPSCAPRRVLRTMLLGVVMAAALWVFAEPALAWLGFVMAAADRSAPAGPGRWPRLRTGSDG